MSTKPPSNYSKPTNAFHQCADPHEWLEELEDGSYGMIPKMAITISPPEAQSTHLSEVYTKLTDSLDILAFSSVLLYPEFSSLGRLHFHGYLYMNNKECILDFYRFDLQVLRALGGIKIKYITDDKIWLDYCCKQQAITKPYLENLNINYNIKLNPKSKKYHYINLNHKDVTKKEPEHKTHKIIDKLKENKLRCQFQIDLPSGDESDFEYYCQVTEVY